MDKENMTRPRLLTEDEAQALRPHQARMEQSATDSSGSVQVGWAWFERREGVVGWGLRNLGTTERSVILLRNSYYFGSAYWSVYSSNPATFRATSFLQGGVQPPPLAGATLNRSAAPLALVQFDGFEQTVICFVFTLSPGQFWATLEGGFDQGGPSPDFEIYDITPAMSGEFCITYDPQAVVDFDDQTRTKLDGYAPNPSTFNTWLFQAEALASYIKPFAGDSVVKGRCAQVVREVLAQDAPQRRTEGGGLFPPVFPDILSPPLNP